MSPSHAAKQEQCNYQAQTESNDGRFELIAMARFQANHIDQPSLNDLIKRGRSEFHATNFPLFREVERRPFDGGLLNLTNILDDALSVHPDELHPQLDGPQSSLSFHFLNQ